MKERILKARSTFDSGYNCAQSVLGSYADKLGTDKESLFALSVGFGGGMGKLQKTCGAVTGAYMALSVYASKNSDDNAGAKEKAYGMIREFDQKFREIKGSTNCREILGVDMNTEEGAKEAAEKNLFGTICADAVGTAVAILEEMID